MRGISRALGDVAVLLLPFVAKGTILISEVADKGTGSHTCEGHDWIELFNDGDKTVSLEDYRLHDEKGVANPDAFSFPDDVEIQSQEYMVLCTEMTLTGLEELDEGTRVADPLSPQFGIGGDDTITLVRVSSGLETNTNATVEEDVAVEVERTMFVEIIHSTGPMPNTNNRIGTSYALDPDTGLFEYTATPTPGAANIISAILTDSELEANLKAKLKAQDDMGTHFFGMDSRGHQVKDDSFPVVLDLHVVMTEDNFATLTGNATWEVYQPFQQASLKNPDTGEELWSRTVPGRIRTKGQSTLFMGVCLGTETIPFQLDISSSTSSSTLDQTLFGAEKIYLRNHMSDYSYMRDHFFNRMLARFGLPHVRARKAQLFINGEKMGFYTLMEAPDQDYVFARNFPEYDPQNFGLYKVKSFALGCGAYTEEEHRNATIRAAELEEQAVDGKLPPLAFERGQHNAPVEEHGLFGADQCFDDFLHTLWGTYVDVVVAYDRNDQDCGKTLVDSGIVDLDLGTKDYDNYMKDFLNEHFRYDRKCDPECANSNIAADMDVDQALRAIAFYAVLVVSDSPLISGNNYYLANTGDGLGWKIVPYDFNQAGVTFCQDDVCNTRAVHWSIARPTCESLEEQQIVGPLLSDPNLHQQYLGYAREFLDTVMTNTSLLEEMETHVNDIAPYMREDFWSIFGAHVDKELSPDAADWQEEEGRFPLLATLKARTEDLREQFEAIDSGTFPRGPHVGVEGDNEPWQVCPDWRFSEPNRTACELGCNYEGCHREDFSVPSFCDESTGKCYHGDFDEQCRGLYDDERYPGMKDTEDGRPTFCRFAKGIPVQTAECPAPGAVKMDSGVSDKTMESRANARATMWMAWPLLSGWLFLQ